MRDYNEVLGFKKFSGFMTSRQLQKIAELTREYKGYTISFGPIERDAEGRTWWNVRVWKNEGKKRLEPLRWNTEVQQMRRQ